MDYTLKKSESEAECIQDVGVGKERWKEGDPKNKQIKKKMPALWMMCIMYTEKYPRSRKLFRNSKRF